MGKRLMDGESLNSGKKIVEERAPVINIDDSNSDDDFEPPAVFSQVARQRPQLLTPTSRMRNDRSSMTKTSANRGKKTKKPICLTTPTQKRGSARMPNAKKRSIPTLESSSSEEEVMDHVVFEGEKSELSETDDDEPIRPPRRERSKHGRDLKHSADSVPHESVRGDVESTVHRRRNAPKAKKSSVHEKNAQPNRMPFNSPAHGSDFRKHEADIFVQVSEQCTESKSAPKRARDLPQLFSDDSDDSVEIPIPKSSKRKRSRRIRRIQESSEEESEQDVEQLPIEHGRPRSGAEVRQSMDVPEIEVVPAAESENESHRGRQDEVCVIDTEIQIEGSNPKRKRVDPNRAASGRLDRSVSGGCLHPSKDFAKSPQRSQTRRRLSFAVSQDTGVTPPSSPSPPSTRKRRLRSKLITVPSDEEDKHREDPPKRPDRIQKSIDFGRVPEENEWYHERKIETFSSSAEDSNDPREKSSPRKVVAVRSKKRVSATKPGTQPNPLTRLSPNPKDRALNVCEDLVDSDRFYKRDVACVQRPRRTTNNDQLKNEVIDLVDDDDFEDICPSRPQKDSTMSSIEDVDGNGVENLNEPPPCDIDDSKPPPFNLYILCKEGESISDMRERLGENELMDKVMQARNAGREIIGGEKLGLTATFNREVFSRFSKTVVGDQVSRQRNSVSITEKALRGEYKFNYRGRDRDQRRRGNPSRRRGSTRTGRGKSYRSRLSNLGHLRR
ncbi:hypothetical protein FGB62_336g029 [Gracilaria domingensis]|nr:hypothetical protein FGB62_336g029 [Gracilaria domingensis]